MNTDRRRAVAALITAGLLWGTTVPLSKLALGWLAPGWLTVARFGLAAAVILPAVPRPRLRAAFSPRILAWGAAGYGGSVMLQNAGITHTSVTHAALLMGALPVLVAIIAAVWRHTLALPVAWAGFVVSLAGVGLVATGKGGGATIGGDALVLVSLALSATFTVAQPRLLDGRDPVAVTAVEFLGAALAALPFSLISEGIPGAPGGLGTVAAAAGLAAGTLLPFTLFAYGQSRVPAVVAGAFVNLEPLVGAGAGVILFGNPAGLPQIAGGVAIIAGIALSSLPGCRVGHKDRASSHGRHVRRRIPVRNGTGRRQPDVIRDPQPGGTGTETDVMGGPGPAEQVTDVLGGRDPAAADEVMGGPEPAEQATDVMGGCARPADVMSGRPARAAGARG